MEFPQAIVSIVTLCIFALLGVPIWWNTTKVYRAPLPHDRIMKLQSSSIKLNINVRILEQSNRDTKMEETSFENFLVDHKHFNFQFQAAEFKLKSGEKDFKTMCDSMESKLDNNEASRISYDILVVNNIQESTDDMWYYCKSGSLFILSVKKDIGVENLKEEISKLLKNILPWSDTRSLESRDQVKKSDSSRSLPLSPGYNIVYTLAVANPLDYLPTWNIEEAIEMYIKPTLKKLDFVGPFQISSQILYFADVQVAPSKDENGTFYYPKSKLPLLINPFESRLNTYTSTDTSLNFIVYVAPKMYSPLYFKRKKSDEKLRTAFHSPRWGGIKIYNPSATNNNGTMAVKDMGDIMQTFLVQFLALNGIKCSEHAQLFPHNRFELLPKWTQNKLLILKTLEHVHTSISTLRSLAKLLDGIANIVIRDDVKDIIDTSVENIERSEKYIAQGDVRKAFEHSKQAFIYSEKAFYDPSLLALLYFPDDQKYAIYVPLFLPISLPIILSFFKAMKWLRKSGSGCKEKVD